MQQTTFNQTEQTILVAEDNQDDAILLEHAFTKAGGNASLKFVRDGEEAVNYVRGEGGYSDRKNFPFPTLLVLDLNLPKKNGLEVLNDLRADLALKRLTAIILTSSIRTCDINIALGLGANSYVFKPSHQNALIAIARRIYDFCLTLKTAHEEIRPRLLLANG